MGWGFSDYTVTISPSPPFNPPRNRYSANQAYYQPAIILSWAILDPSVDYHLEFTSLGNGLAEVWNLQYYFSK